MRNFINKKINCGIIGCGRISYKHIDIFKKKKLKKLNLISISDLDLRKTKKIKNKIKNVNIFKNYREILSNKKIDVIIVLTESGSHYKICKEALLNNKHVIVEKPLCLKINHARELISLSNLKKKKIFVIMQNRFNNPIQITKHKIEKKKLGKIVLVSIRVRWFRDHSYYSLDKWRGTWKHDGGALTNQGIHHIDLLQWLGGKVDTVFAYTARRLNKIKSEDTAIGSLKFKNGALGNIEVTTAARPRDLEGSISILGEKGTVEVGGFAANKIITWEFINKKNNILKKNKYYENPKNVYGFGHEKNYIEIYKNLLGKKNEAVTAKDSLHSLEILHALYESSITKKEVRTNKTKFKNKLNYG
jgi:UDP-N-acetyl-2-amino-2-deoxyglucuronate dehydrogenase